MRKNTDIRSLRAHAAVVCRHTIVVIKKSVCIVWFSICFLVFSAAAGRRDAGLDEIDRLIQEHNYNQALLLLHTYISEYPDDFDAAQKRVDIILRERSTYNQIAQELFETVTNEPDNNEKKLSLIAQLEQMEQNQSGIHVNFIRQIQTISQFAVNRERFNRVMAEGIRLVSQDRYADAVLLYADNYDLYQAEFFERFAHTDTEAKAREFLYDMRNPVDAFGAQSAALASYIAQFEQELEAADWDNAVMTAQYIQQTFSRLAGLRNRAAGCGIQMRNLYNMLYREYEDITDASFPAFAYRLTLGISSDSQSGIVGAMDWQWRDAVDRIQTAIYRELSGYLHTITDSGTLLPRSAFAAETIRDTSAELRRLLTLSRQFSDLYALLTGADGSFLPDFTPQYMAMIENTRRVNAAFTSLLDIYDRKSAIDAEYEQLDMTDTQALLSYLYRYTAVQEQAVQASRPEPVANTAGIAPIAAGEPGSAFTDTAERAFPIDAAFSVYELLHTAVVQSCSNTVASVSSLLAQRYVADTVRIVRNYQSRYTQAEQILFSVDENGTPHPDPQGAIAHIQHTLTVYERDSDIITAYIDTLRQSDLESASVSAIETEQRLLLSYRQRYDSLLRRAESWLQSARLAQNEAELRIAQAEAQLARGDFNGARIHLQTARHRYNESFEFQESVELRDESDAVLFDLDKRIASAENELVIRDVRRYKNLTIAAYYTGDFVNAQAYLQQAQSRWNTTHIEEDQELVRLAALINTALEMQTGRVVTPPMPLYPEISQLLNSAQQLFEQGKELLAQGSTDEAHKALYEAMSHIQDVQLVYPLNEQAGILSLQIEQILDPDNFETLFAQRYAQAAADFADPALRRSAYAQLSFLEIIYPEYPGLREFMYDIEIQLGIRQPEISESAKQQARQRVSEAQRLYDLAGDSEQVLMQVLAAADEAIALDPFNEAAAQLKDRVQLRIGGQISSILSSEDEIAYQQALQELQRGNMLGAKAIAEELLLKPENQQSVKVRTLLQRVNALL